ncbi:MAG: glycosyltransferase family 4 protein [Anaerolineae bacterium]
MKVSLLTPIRKGGPYSWGADLTYVLNRNGVLAKHVHSLPMLLKSCFYQDGDIVHTTVPIPFKLWETPTVFTIHADYTIEQNMWQRFCPKTIAQASAITTPSHYLKQRLGLERAAVIPNAIFPERFKPVEHREKEVLNLVTVTNFHFLDKARGLINIAQILERVQNKYFKYTVIGGGIYLKRVKEEVTKRPVSVQFTGFLTDPKQALAQSDIFLYYSCQDNFPIVILEAMACGLPVITNDVGAVKEVVESEKDGYIAPSDDAYLGYLLNLLGDARLRAKIGEAARKAVETKFDWAKIVDEYIKIYQALL